MQMIYVVSVKNKGFIKFFSNEQAARECVEHISVIEFGMRTDKEIFEDQWGNQSVWYGMYDLLDKFE